ncbi:MAG: FCD domain-containing protein [Mycobacterium sp.]
MPHGVHPVAQRDVLDERWGAHQLSSLARANTCTGSDQPQEARDFLTVFASFEGEIAAAAALRHDEEQVLELDQALDLLHAVEQTAGTDDRGRQYFVQNARFHGVVHSMSRSPLVADLSRRMWYLSDFLMYSYAGADAIATAVAARNHDHDLIRTAVVGRNDVVAKAAMEHHIRSITGLFS